MLTQASQATKKPSILQSCFSSAALGLSSALVLSSGLLAEPASAQSLKGSFGLSGSANLTRTNQPSPNTTRIRFQTVNVDAATGDFSGITFNSGKPRIRPLLLTNTRGRRYAAGPVNNFIRFGRVDIGGQTGRLTFDLDRTTVRRVFNSPNNLIEFTPQGFSGNFNFRGSTFGTGFFSASRTGGSESYQLTVKAVPEPLTVLGTIAAIGILGVGKRELDKAQSRTTEDR